MKNTGFETKRRMIDLIDENWNAEKAKDKNQPGGCYGQGLARTITGGSSSAVEERAILWKGALWID